MKQAYIVYYGTINCDDDLGNGPTHNITTFETPEDVEEFYKQFRKNIRDDDTYSYFRVFKGIEMMLREVKTVTSYKLGEV
jgi:hypothetical protein